MFSIFVFLYTFNNRIFCDAVQLLDISLSPFGSAYFLGKFIDNSSDSATPITTSSNIDGYAISGSLGDKTSTISFSGSKLTPRPNDFKISVHIFNTGVHEDSKTIHFLCHADVDQKTNFEMKKSPIGAYQPVDSSDLAACCVISINTSFSMESSSCMLNFSKPHGPYHCHLEISLPPILWKQKYSPSVRIFQNIVYYPLDESSGTRMHRSSDGGDCNPAVIVSDGSSKSLHSASILRTVPDAFRELGKNLLLQIPRRELKNGEEFIVPVRLKQSEEISGFTLRCEIPSNSFVEFVRVIWPGGGLSGGPKRLETALYSQPDLGNSGTNIVWDIFHRNIITQKRNATEIIARFREDLAKVKYHTNPSFSSASEVYKLLFRVTRPPKGSSERVAPRIFWSLVSLQHRDSDERRIGGSPLVTRLNIESSEWKHLAMVIKNSALVNLAALTGQPSVHSVWVYALTHDNRVMDVTDKATCHTGDDAIIHFANDVCSRLTFSGAELDGSPGLPLVAKLGGRSATTNLLVWFPKPPALRLVVQRSDGSQFSNSAHGYQKPVLISQLLTEPHTTSLPNSIQWDANKMADENYYKPLQIRVFAKFILAGSVLYGKDVLGGEIDGYVDVTEYTVHRLRLVHPIPSRATLNYSIARLVITGSESEFYRFESRVVDNRVEWHPKFRNPPDSTIRVWLVGDEVGQATVFLDSINPLAMAGSSIPVGLAKQLKDQKSLKHTNFMNTMSAEAPPKQSLLFEISGKNQSWPVGLSAQIVTGISMSLSHQIDSRLSYDSDQSSVGDPPNAKTVPGKIYEQMSLFSGLYLLKTHLQGSPKVHCGKVPAEFNEEILTPATGFEKMHIPPGPDTSSPTYSSSFSRYNPSGLLVIWIHMSDGGQLLWHQLIELYRLMKKVPPFQLSIRNLRPDLIGIEGSSIHMTQSRRRRSPSDFESPKLEYIWIPRTPFVRPHDEHLMYDDATYATRSEKSSNRPWSGPMVLLKDENVTYTGNVLEVALQSKRGQLLLPSLRVASNFLSSNIVHSKTQAGIPDSIPTYGDGVVFHDKPSLTHNKLNNIHNRPSSLSSSSNEDNHDLMAHKDAPGLRFPSNRNSLDLSTKGDEASLSDQLIQNNPYEADHYLPDRNKLKFPKREPQRASKSALEMTMYVLLGLFALVGLVFAVNCGAVVARYRWERIRQTAPTDPTELRQLSREDDLGHSGGDKPTHSQDQQQTSGKVTTTSESCNEKCKRMNLYKKLWQPRIKKHKPLLLKDENWIWISRGDVSAAETEHTLKRSSTVHAPLTESSNLRAHVNDTNRAQHGSTKTTALLSVGEGDVLLVHSPYHWKSQLAGMNHKMFPTLPEEANSSEYSHYNGNTWNISKSGIKTVGRPVRRHTAGMLMQRNYQGQECSIRIISNPVSSETEVDSNSPYSKLGMNDPNSILSDKPYAHIVCENTPIPHHEHLSCQPQLVQPPYQWPVHLMPNQPYPQIGDKINASNAEMYWEAIMYRSWFRSRNVVSQMPLHMDFGGIPSINPHINDHILHPPSNKQHNVITNRKSFMDRLDGDLDVLCPPLPPTRTTSRGSTCGTMGSRKSARRKSHSAPCKRPLSMPQNIQAMNELYNILSTEDEMGDSEANLGSNRKMHNLENLDNQLKSTASEESLWWYHPVRQQRRRRRKHEGHLHGSHNLKHGSTKADKIEMPTTDGIQQFQHPETVEYAQPIICDCTNELDQSGRPAAIGLCGTETIDGEPPRSHRIAHVSTLASISDSDWDRELLALSHDRLVAYFADMKESMA